MERTTLVAAIRGSLLFPAVLLAMLVPASMAAGSESMPHLRALNGEARALLAIARQRSPLTQTSIEALDNTDVVVLLLVEPMLASTPPGYLTFVSAAGPCRYVAVKINSNLHPLRRVALLAHELQHALEVAAAPDVRDTPSLVALYRRIGYQVGSGKWETDSARTAGERAQREFTGESDQRNPFGFPAVHPDSARRPTNSRY